MSLWQSAGLTWDGRIGRGAGAASTRFQGLKKKTQKNGGNKKLKKSAGLTWDGRIGTGAASTIFQGSQKKTQQKTKQQKKKRQILPVDLDLGWG